jgi:DNA polymerase III subunit chi
MQVDFYQLSRRPIERVLPQIAERVLAGGGRLLVVSDDGGQRTMLDKALWTYAPESFLPHAEAGAGDDARQPVLLSSGVEPANGARFVALVDGRWRDEALGFERAFHFFDETNVDAARAAWRALGAREGLTRNYHRQTERGWEKVA